MRLYERKYDCVKYDDCLMDAATSGAREFTCAGCCSYEKNPGYLNLTGVRFVANVSHAPDIQWVLRKQIIARSL